MLQLVRTALVAAVATVASEAPLSPAPARAGDAAISLIVRTETSLFYVERPAGSDDARLMVRRGGAAARLLLDPDQVGRRSGWPARLSIVSLLPSPDGTRIAVGLRPGPAAAQTQTRIVDALSGTVLGDDEPRTRFGAGAWSLDGTTFFSNVLLPAAPGAADSSGERSAVVAHRLGMSGMDARVFGFGVDPNVPCGPGDDPMLTIPSGSSYAIGAIAHPGRRELTLYAAPIAAVLSGGQIPWDKIVDVADGVTGFDVHGATAYFLANANPPHSTVTALDLSAAENGVTVVVPAGAGVIEQIAVAGDALYVRGTRGGSTELRKLPWAADGTAGAITAVPLPASATVTAFATDARVDGAIVGLMTRTQPLRVELLDARGALVDAGIGDAELPDARIPAAPARADAQR
jgi:prolyl oligopeptidase